MTIAFGVDQSEFTYQNHILRLKNASTTGKLLSLLVRKRFLEKQHIASFLYGREYQGVEDDRRIYYHVHSLRKKLKSIGIPEHAIISEKNGYRLVPKVETVGGELCT